MKQTRLLMGMPITVEILDPGVTSEQLDAVYDFFISVDERFSLYKEASEISRINRGELRPAEYSEDMRAIIELCALTKRQTDGYFEIAHNGRLDPSGVVKGWAIQQAAKRLRAAGWRDFFIDAGGDIQMSGIRYGALWRVGIRNPFRRQENVKVLALTDCGVATSGTAVRGQHIYDPFQPGVSLREIVSLTVIGPSVLEADRFATAAFAMGRRGIQFIEALPGFEGYQIDASARATYTSGFERYVVHE
ncbi:MAG TPA: FAD:protein FMN transferase [Nitrolancea sp.]|jgi:thiamine biosynthesis lipoprotein|nr:FAD:protein FMN transferase [Nitrolancea sp.]